MLRRVGCVGIECARIANDCVVEKANDACWAVDASTMVAESVEIFLDGQFWLDPEVFGPDQVAFARRMDVEHVNYRSWKSETKRYVVADSPIRLLKYVIVFPNSCTKLKAQIPPYAGKDRHERAGDGISDWKSCRDFRGWRLTRATATSFKMLCTVAS